MRVMVIGCGTVGEAVALAAEGRGHTVTRHDPPQGLHEYNASADLALVCVPTPSTDTGACDTSIVRDEVLALRDAGFRGVAAIRSTVPPQTALMLRGVCEGVADFALITWPEFLRAATATEQAASPRYHVWGVRDADRERVLPLLHEFVAGGAEAPTLVLTPDEAMFLKYASNILIASQVTVANQLYDLADAANVDWRKLECYADLEPLVGPTIHVTEERGFGGACLPKDLSALVEWGRGHGQRVALLAAVQAYNRSIRGEQVAQAYPDINERGN